MHANSRQVSSNQAHLHPQLATVVNRHLRKPGRKPIAPHNSAAFAALEQALAKHSRPLVLDSFCGTGHSTALLAQRHPDHLVVGIDKSAQRLARHPGSENTNYLLLQAECEDVWQLINRAGLVVDYHYILYPNPWPKSRHLQRRVHGHASFELLLQLARRSSPGSIELRSNWQLYVEEFGYAMHLAGFRGFVTTVAEQPALSLFEQKYRDSGHTLWQYSARCAHQSP